MDQTFLAIDTATTAAVVALGGTSRAPLGDASWSAGYRHGEDLLTEIEGLLARLRIALDQLDGIVVGTGPGAFTGLRVGMATAKGLAHGLGIPIAGIASSTALLFAAQRALAAQGGTDEVALALLLPAGPSDRVLVYEDTKALLPGGQEPNLPSGTTFLAVDLDGRAPSDAAELGERARAGLGEALLQLGAARLTAGDADDLAGLVPEYVTLPRGVTREAGEVTWSRDPR